MATTSQSFSGARSAIGAYYDEHGYVVMPGLLDPATIDAVLARYAGDILPSRRKFYRQNSNVYDRNRLTPHGHVAQSFLDIHDYRLFPAFRKAVLDLYFSTEMAEALRLVTGHETHTLMQSMLFDANVATQPHQDWWYLDTVPHGHLLGAWIAMEDIDERAGRFFVLPGTHGMRLHERDMPHSVWLARIDSHVRANLDGVLTPVLRKGDVLFWNSRTIHGSHPTGDPRYSRKSLTAHFMPAEMRFGNLFTSKPWVKLQDYGAHRYFANQPEYSRKAELVSRVKQAVYDSPRVMRLIRRFQNRAVADV